MKTNRQQAKDIMARIHELLQPPYLLLKKLYKDGK